MEFLPVWDMQKVCRATRPAGCAPADADECLDKAQPADLLCSFEVMHYSQLRLKSQWIRCVLMIQLPFLPLLYPV